MSETCEVCRGSKRIRVPLYKMAVAGPIDGGQISIDDYSREFQCPECSSGDNIPSERLLVGRMVVHARDDIRDESFERALRRHLARQLAEDILARGFMTIKRGHDDPDRGTYALHGTVGVVSPQHVAKFEERVRKRQFEVAAALVEESIKDIKNWGSHYGMRMVEKSDAVRWLGEAFGRIRKKYG